MACGSCGSKPPLPWIREGLPTVWAWGPFLDYEVVDYAEVENGLVPEE